MPEPWRRLDQSLCRSVLVPERSSENQIAEAWKNFGPLLAFEEVYEMPEMPLSRQSPATMERSVARVPISTTTNSGSVREPRRTPMNGEGPTSLPALFSASTSPQAVMNPRLFRLAQISPKRADLGCLSHFETPKMIASVCTGDSAIGCPASIGTPFCGRGNSL